MNNYIDECLITLGEECAEVIQAVSKIQRFGISNYHPSTPDVSNKEHLQREIADVLCMIDLLREEGFIDEHLVQNAKLQKRIKFKQYSTFSPTHDVVLEQDC